MKRTTHSVLAALATAAVLASVQAHAQQTGNVPVNPRPADPTANLPSDTGSQTTLPSGAVTGAGQPQGTTRQQDLGAPGGLERRARQAERNDARGAASAGQTGRTAAESDTPAASPGQRARRAGRNDARGATSAGQTGRTAAESDTPAASPGAAGMSEGGAGTRRRAARQSRG